MKYRALKIFKPFKQLRILAVLVLSLNFFAFMISPSVSASKYSCGTYGGGYYLTGECPKKGILAPLTGLGSPLLILLAIVGIGGGVFSFLALKRRKDKEVSSDH